MDPNNFKVENPTFFVHKSQMESYCIASEQEMKLVNPMYFPYANQPDDPGMQQEQSWTDVSQPLLDFLSNIGDKQICSDVPEEMLIGLSTPESTLSLMIVMMQLIWIIYLMLSRMTYYGSLSFKKGP